MLHNLLFYFLTAAGGVIWGIEWCYRKFVAEKKLTGELAAPPTPPDFFYA